MCLKSHCESSNKLTGNRFLTKVIGRSTALEFKLEADDGSVGNAVKDLDAGFSLYVAVRSANERIFAERKATYLPTR